MILGGPLLPAQWVSPGLPSPSTYRPCPQLPPNCSEPGGACARVCLGTHNFLLRTKSPSWGSLDPQRLHCLLFLSRCKGTSCWKEEDTSTPSCPSLLTQSTSNHGAHTPSQMASTLDSENMYVSKTDKNSCGCGIYLLKWRRGRGRQ